MKIGAITVGQSPRLDVTQDIMPMFQGNVELIEKGALDGLSYEEISWLAPEAGDYVLVSRLQDGTEVRFAERLILGNIQRCIDELEQQGVTIILFFCTGEFSHSFRSKVPLIFPCHILHQIIPLLNGDRPVVIVNPDCSQKEQSIKKWSRFLDVEKAEFIAASPYGDWADIENAANQIKKLKGELVILDCIGYTQKMKGEICRISGKPVILSKTLLARIVSELTDDGM